MRLILFIDKATKNLIELSFSLKTFKSFAKTEKYSELRTLIKLSYLFSLSSIEILGS